MRFIRCARHPDEQNMYAFQYCGNVFYRAFRDIPMGTEMLVWYDVRYPQFMGIPVGLQDIQFIRNTGLTYFYQRCSLCKATRLDSQSRLMHLR